MEEEKKELPKKRWFGRGIYGSKDVPIRILDGLIAFLIVLTVALTAVLPSMEVMSSALIRMAGK